MCLRAVFLVPLGPADIQIFPIFGSVAGFTHVGIALGGSIKGEAPSHTALQQKVKPSGRSLSGGRSIQFNPKHW